MEDQQLYDVIIPLPGIFIPGGDIWFTTTNGHT